MFADRAREEQWSYERFAEALLSTEVSTRDSHGGEGRIKTARFPPETLEEFDFTFQRSVKKTVVEHLGQLAFLADAQRQGKLDQELDRLERIPLGVVTRSATSRSTRRPRA